jgi:hypothetical protein
VQKTIWQAWPDVLLMAVVATPQVGGGYDIPKMAEVWTRSRKAADAGAEVVTAEYIQSELWQISNQLGLEDDGAEDCPLKAMAIVLSHVCDPLPVPLDALPNWIADQFTLPDLPDLLRAIWDVCGGFPGDMRERFTERS